MTNNSKKGTTMYTTQFYESYIPNNKPNKHNPNNQNNDINVGFTTNTKFVLLQLRQRKFWSIHIQISTNFKKFTFNQFRTFHPLPICTFHHSRKTCTWFDEQFRTFHPSLHESVTPSQPYSALPVMNFGEFCQCPLLFQTPRLLSHVHSRQRSREA